MTESQILKQLDYSIGRGEFEAFARLIRADRWPHWSLRNVRRRVHSWLNPDQLHHFPLTSYRHFLEAVGIDPLAEIHAGALELGRRKRAERELERARRDLEQLPERPQMMTVRAREGMRETG